MKIRGLGMVGSLAVIFAVPAWMPAEDAEEMRRPAERVTVETSRLTGHAVEADRVPQAAVVITREQIERSSAATVYELLAGQPEMVFYDQVGNGKEAVLDIRGFNEGTALALFVDGVRMNEPDDNRVLMMQIPLEWVERVEILKGSSSTVLGGGALSGAIRIFTRSGGNQSRVSFRGGSFGAAGFAGETGRETSVGSISAGAGFDRSSGFRENSDSRSGWGYARFRRLSGTMAFGAAYSYVDTSFGAPGALTADEMDADRKQAPFNSVDENDAATHVLAGDLQVGIGTLTLTGNAFLRRNETASLTTGRSAALFGGFATEQRTTSSGGTIQLSAPLAGGALTVTGGAELTFVGLDADGFSTDKGGVSRTKASQTDTGENWQGLYLQAESIVASRVTLLAGLRYDRQSIDFLDVMTGYQADREFEKLTYKGGATFSWNDRTATFVHVGSAYQTPTIVDLFAYPLFFSNPDLRPSTARTIEVGQRVSAGAFSAQASAYDLEVDDEVIYVMTDPVNFIGRNENAGRSRRRGFDAAARWSSGGTSLHGAYSYIHTRFLSGDFEGNELVMVPRHKLEAGVTQQVTKSFSVGGRVLHTGAQLILGDEMSSAPELKSWTTLDLKAAYAMNGWRIEGVIRNLLNSEYETRAITNGFQTYYTPAAGINGTVSIGYAF